MTSTLIKYQYGDVEARGENENTGKEPNKTLRGTCEPFRHLIGSMKSLLLLC